jgi:sugar lactone lactonase YvrE
MKYHLLLALCACILAAQAPSEKGLLLRRAARIAVQKADKAEAIKSLQQLMDLQTGYDPGEDLKTFGALQGEPGFLELLQRSRKEFPPVVRSKEAFVVSDWNLIPEGLAFDPVGRAFYLGSLSTAKICRITLDGTVSDFATQNGLGVVVGLRVDAQRRILWAANQGSTEAGVFGFDLASGKLLRKGVIPMAGHFFNDLAVCPKGNVYVTDTYGDKIYRLRPGGSELEALDVQVLRPNGITLSEDGKLLFVTDAMLGGLRVDLATLQSAPLGTSGNLSLLGIDGFYAQGRTLIAIHNGYTSTQVVRYHLDAGLSQVERVEVLERNDPSWKLPTTGAIAEGWFYFMANSQVNRYSIPENAITPGAPVEPIRILKTKL